MIQSLDNPDARVIVDWYWPSGDAEMYFLLATTKRKPSDVYGRFEVPARDVIAYQRALGKLDEAKAYLEMRAREQTA